MRLFLAVSPDERCRARLMADAAPLREGIPAVRWVREEHLHVTLTFLGDVDGGRVEDVSAAVRPIAAVHAPFPVSLAGGGAFPNLRRPRVVWVGMGNPHELRRLGEEISRACATLGFGADREFRPHLTIGRVAREPSSAERRRLEEGLEALRGPYAFAIRHVDLFQSVLGTRGPHHTVLASFPLGGA